MSPKSAVANPKTAHFSCSFKKEVEPAAVRRSDAFDSAVSGSCKRARDYEDDFARQVRKGMGMMTLGNGCTSDTAGISRESSVDSSEASDEASECDEGTDFGWLCSDL